MKTQARCFRALLPFLCMVFSLVPAAGAQGVMGGKAQGGSPAPGQERPHRPLPEVPVRIVSIAGGTLLVSDYGTRCIFELDPQDLWPIRWFPVKGAPLGVARLGRRILVGNGKTHRVEIYELQGRLLGWLGGANTQFGQPNDIATARTLGLAAVVDSTGRTVHLFDLKQAPQGVEVLTLPAGGPDPQVLARPAGVVLDPAAGEILVSDFGATEQSIQPRIQVFGLDGTVKSTISSKQGMMGYRFYRPQGMALDGKGGIFVTDSYLGRILLIDRATGDTLQEYGTYGTGPGELTLPLDAAVTGTPARLYVTNYGLGRIEVFSLGGGGG